VLGAADRAAGHFGRGAHVDDLRRLPAFPQSPQFCNIDRLKHPARSIKDVEL